MSESHEQLLEQRVRDREADALNEYIEVIRPQLLTFIEKNCSAKLKQKIEAQDLLQEVHLSALNQIESTDLSQRTPFSWLCQISEQRIIDAHRRYVLAQKRAAGREVGLMKAGSTSKPQLIDYLVASLTSPSQMMARDQRKESVRAAIEKLPEVNQQALILRYVEDLPSKEIAEKMDKTDGAVRVLLSRSLKLLQQVLMEESMFHTKQTSTRAQPPNE